MAESTPQPRAIERLASLPLVLEWALGLRIAAAVVVGWYTHRKGLLCVLPDTQFYWILAGTIRDGVPYEVLQYGEIPHFAVRTPGYPLFLAACRLLFGDRPMAVRLVQAVLGTLAVWLVYELGRCFTRGDHDAGRRGWTIPLVAAALSAFHPYLVVTSALMLSEAVFLPLMLAGLWCLAVASAAGQGTHRRWAWALGAGVAWGAAVLVRPSWALFVPVVPVALLVVSGRGQWTVAARSAVLVGLGAIVVLTPWWVRNARVFGRFVPTAIWTGASLYDGLNPGATGASDMAFMEAPDIWPLEEQAQDAELRRRALAFVRERPGRALWLAVVKLGRYWSPWPNAGSLRSPLVILASASFTVPLFALIALGAFDRRRDLRALILLAGPLLYFCALHVVFASSIRYRIPVEMPAMVLAAAGVERIRRGGRQENAVVNYEANKLSPLPPGEGSG